ncbi:MAG: protein kinase [Planctomycetes bacterium]|nr:protein kinase [Planctomycetota bacterium]
MSRNGSDSEFNNPDDDALGSEISQEPPDPVLLRLMAYDECLRRGGQLAAGGLAGIEGSADPEESSLYECLHLLDRAWPRHTVAEVDEFPAQIGRFRPERVLGMGGFGIVYLAFDTELNRQVTLKVPRLHVLASPKLRERFKREARAVAALDHPHIVPLYETGEIGPICYIVSKYYPGYDLAEWLSAEQGLVSVRWAVQLVRVLADAVEYSHSKKVLHCDLKPSNVILTPDMAESAASANSDLPFIPRLTDFGLAIVLSEDAPQLTTTVQAGTPTYIAPEQTGTGFGKVGPATDVYGLGIILYEMLTGRPPFQGTGVAEVFDLVRTADPVSPRTLRASVPRDLETVCLKCLEKQPGERLQTAGQLARELERILQGRPTETRPPSAPERAWKLLKRHPTRAATIGSLVFAIALVAASITWYAMSLAEARRAFAEKQKEVEVEREKGELRQTLIVLAGIRERSQSRPRGWSHQNLDELRKAARFASDPAVARSLRTEAVRALSAIELQLVKTALTDLDTYGLQYSPDGRFLAAGNNLTDNDHDDSFVRLIDTGTWREVRRLKLPVPYGPQPHDRPEGVRSLLFSPDWNSLVIGTRHGRVGAFNVATGACELNIQADRKAIIELGCYGKAKMLTTLGEDQRMELWHWPVTEGSGYLEFSYCESLAAADDRLFVTAEGKLHTIRHHNSLGVALDQSATIPARQQVTLLPDRRVAVTRSNMSGTDALILFDSNSNRVCRTLFDRYRNEIHDGELHSLAVSADRRWLISTAGDGLNLWNLVSGEIVATLPNSVSGRVSAAFDPNRPEFAVSRDGRVEIWRIADSGVWDSTLRQCIKVSSIDLSANGKYLAASIIPQVTRAHGEDIAIADINRDVCVFERKIWQPLCSAVALSNDGRFLSHTSHHDGGITRITQIDTHGHLPDAFLSPPVADHGKPIFAEDGSRVWYSGRSNAGRVGFISQVTVAGAVAVPEDSWHWSNDESERKLRKSGILSLAVGKRLVAASSLDETVRLFDAATGNQKGEIPLSPKIIDHLALSADERRLFCGTRKGELLVLATDDGRMLWQETAHTDAVTALCLGPGGLAFTASRDGSLAGWQLSGDEPVELFRFGQFYSNVRDLDLSHDESLLAVLVEAEQGVRLLRIDRLRDRLQELGLNW